MDLDKPCLLWTGTTATKGGYGRVRRDGKLWRVHRYAWTVAYGPIPEGLDVCHKCDTPACYEVSHLFLGTRQANMLDAADKGRTSRINGDTCIARGHDLTLPNSVILRAGPNGRLTRRCRECQRIAQRAYRARRSPR